MFARASAGENSLSFANSVLQFNMLRGNHETSLINNAYGFRDELKTLYGDEATQLWAVCNHMFAFMPLAALLDNRVLCMHGGVSERLNTLDDIRNVGAISHVECIN